MPDEFESLINGGAARAFPGAAKSLNITDNIQIGLRARIDTDGSVVLWYRNGTHDYKIDLGEYPALSVDKARHLSALLKDLPEDKAHALITALK